jgi:phosphinothricin acetyltransferase
MPNEEGKGIGKAILQYLIDLAKNQNLHTMIAVIDFESNHFFFHNFWFL